MRFSRIGIIGDGSFLKDGIALPQGSLGLQPSLENLLTFSLELLLHFSILFITASGSVSRKGRTANSQLIYAVITSIASREVFMSSRPYTSTKSGRINHGNEFCLAGSSRRRCIMAIMIATC